MKKIYTYLIFSFALLCSTSLIAQTNEKARETAVMIADRILKSTTYDFVDKKSGKTYTSLKNVPLNKNVKVQSKYLDWHYTNGVTNIALMELGDKLGTSKYENYVLKNMNFIFDDANQDYFHRLYNQTLEQEGWRAVNHVNWHMIYRNKRLDDNGPMGALLADCAQPPSSGTGFPEVYRSDRSSPDGVRTSSCRWHYCPVMAACQYYLGR